MADAITSIPNSTQALDEITGGYAGAGEGRVTQKSLGQDDFFKLLTTQLASQDPLQPMEDTAFIAQMANFSSLEMMNNLNNNFENFTSTQQFQASQGYIGKKVTMLIDGAEISGVATGLETDDTGTRVYVDGRGYPIDRVFRVETATAEELADASNGGGAVADGDSQDGDAQTPDTATSEAKAPATNPASV